MCVIFIVDSDDLRPSQEEVQAAFDANDDGGGTAHRETAGGVSLVRWKKNLGSEEMIDRCLTLPVPYVAHFRIASCGGIRPELCHPFPLEDGIPLDLEGTTANGVLFHNGHWNMWERELKSASYEGRIHLSHGPWMDSRALAFILHHYGPGHLDMINEKTVHFGPEGDIPVFGPFGTGAWQYYKNKFLVSNSHWTYKLNEKKAVDPTYTTPLASQTALAVHIPRQAGGPADQTTFRTRHGEAGEGSEGGEDSLAGDREAEGRKSHLQEQIEEVAEVVRTCVRQGVEDDPQKGVGDEREAHGRGRRTARGWTYSDDHSLSDDDAVRILNHLQDDDARWTRKLCEDRNPKRFRSSGAVTQDDLDRMARSARLKQGIITLGRL